jgi:hypothetical protein
MHKDLAFQKPVLKTIHDPTWQKKEVDKVNLAKKNFEIFIYALEALWSTEIGGKFVTGGILEKNRLQFTKNVKCMQGKDKR